MKVAVHVEGGHESAPLVAFKVETVISKSSYARGKVRLRDAANTVEIEIDVDGGRLVLALIDALLDAHLEILPGPR